MTGKDKLTTEDVAELCAKRRKLLDNAAQMQEQAKEIGAQVIEYLQSLPVTADENGEVIPKRIIYADEDGNSLSETLVQPESVVIDEDRLKRKIGAEAWKSVTKVVLDKKALEGKISAGAINLQAVASVSTTEEGTPYLRVTRGRKTKALSPAAVRRSKASKVSKGSTTAKRTRKPPKRRTGRDK